MKILLLTGMLASGKSIALRMLQDLGYYCIDNLPPSLIRPFIEIAQNSNPKIDKIALVIDMRGEAFFSSLDEALSDIRRTGDCEILFFDADDEILIQRYKLQRRKHLMGRDERIEETIKRERETLSGLLNMADHVIDTSQLVDDDLKKKLQSLFVDFPSDRSITVNIVSFGFKYGILKDADLVMDVRFLPNPYYVSELRMLDGRSEEIKSYVMSFEVTRQFTEKFADMIRFLIPHYIKEGKSQLIIGIGCSGGRHRSAAIAQEISGLLKSDNTAVFTEHRDIEKDKYDRV